MKATPSNSVAAAVRAYFGLSQVELAQFLGLTRGQVAHAEAGRRGLSRATNLRLNQLADLLPPPLGEGPPEPAVPDPLSAELLDLEPIRRRQRRCAWKAANRRWELDKLNTATQRARRWQQVLPTLLGALPTDPANTAAERQRRWLDNRAAMARETLDGASSTTRVLLALRIEALEAARLKLLLARQ